MEKLGLDEWEVHACMLDSMLLCYRESGHCCSIVLNSIHANVKLDMGTKNFMSFESLKIKNFCESNSTKSVTISLLTKTIEQKRHRLSANKILKNQFKN